MRNLLKTLTVIALVALAPLFLGYSTASAQNSKDISIFSDELPYRFINKNCDYGFDVPSPPSLTPIIANKPLPVPLLSPPDIEEEIGIAGLINLQDLQTREIFKVNIYCITLPKALLKTIDNKHIHNTLKEMFMGYELTSAKMNFTPDDQVLKWSSIYGYTNSDGYNLTRHAGHFITGPNTITVIKAEYSAENPAYQRYFTKLEESIRLN